MHHVQAVPFQGKASRLGVRRDPLDFSQGVQPQGDEGVLVGQGHIGAPTRGQHAEGPKADPDPLEQCPVLVVQHQELPGIGAGHQQARRRAGQRGRLAAKVRLPHPLTRGQREAGDRPAGGMARPECVPAHEDAGASERGVGRLEGRWRGGGRGRRRCRGDGRRCRRSREGLGRCGRGLFAVPGACRCQDGCEGCSCQGGSFHGSFRPLVRRGCFGKSHSYSISDIGAL